MERRLYDASRRRHQQALEQTTKRQAAEQTYFSNKSFPKRIRCDFASHCCRSFPAIYPPIDDCNTPFPVWVRCTIVICPCDVLLKAAFASHLCSCNTLHCGWTWASLHIVYCRTQWKLQRCWCVPHVTLSVCLCVCVSVCLCLCMCLRLCSH